MEKDKYKIPRTPERNKFKQTYGDLQEKEVLLEILFYQKQQDKKLNIIKDVIVWLFIIIPLIILVHMFIFSVFF